MTRKEHIDAILKTMDDWDLQTLQDSAKVMRRFLLEDLPDDELRWLYEEEVLGTHYDA
jgi:hypothetical protein